MRCAINLSHRSIAIEPQIVAILVAIESRLTELIELATDPLGRVSQAQTDTLRSYGMIAQISEVISIQRDQLMALSDAISILIGRFIEHDRRVNVQHDAMLEMLQALAHSVGATDIAHAAADARAVLQAEAEAQLAAIELGASQARELLGIARMDARSVVRAAVDHAQIEIVTEAALSRAELVEDADAARHVVADAEAQARETLKEEAEEHN